MTFIDALRNQRQIDEDGCFVGVSREAVEMAIDEINHLRAENEALKNYLRMIEHATAPTLDGDGYPTLDDGRYHENAYTLAQAALRGEWE